MKRSISILTLTLSLGAAFAADQTLVFNPLTVKAGENMRITLFNPNSDPLEVRVFAYNATESSYDEGTRFVIAPGRLRFFDFPVPKDFVGLGGVIETVPDEPAPAAEDRKTGGQGKPSLKLEDILVSSAKSRGSLQHRTASGQSQTMGYSFGATQTGSWFKSMRERGPVANSLWIASPEY